MKKLLFFVVLSLVAVFPAVAIDFDVKGTQFDVSSHNDLFANRYVKFQTIDVAQYRQSSQNFSSRVSQDPTTVEEVIEQRYGSLKLYRAIKRRSLTLASVPGLEEYQGVIYLGFSKIKRPEGIFMRNEKRIRDPEIGIRIHF